MDQLSLPIPAPLLLPMQDAARLRRRRNLQRRQRCCAVCRVSDDTQRMLYVDARRWEHPTCWLTHDTDLEHLPPSERAAAREEMARQQKRAKRLVKTGK